MVPRHLQFTRHLAKEELNNKTLLPGCSSNCYEVIFDIRSIMGEVARTIKREMACISSSDHDSILRDNVEAVKKFSWDTVTLELQSKVPTLMLLLLSLVRNPYRSKPFIASLACQLLKDSHPCICCSNKH